MYATHFGLVESPFSTTPDPRFSYTNSLYREAFATLRYGIEARKGFIVITGEAGTGKTTLLRRLMRSVEATVHTAFVFNTHLSFNELLRLVLNDLGVPSCADDKLTLIAHLNNYLVAQLDRDHTVALLVDEAQDLSNEMLEELRLLSNLETDRAKLIQIVLMGQPELELKLDQPELRQLKQRVAIRCRLAPLSSNEVAPYIDSRLHTVGYKGEALFDPESVETIARYSKGIPRLINVICDNALLVAYATSQPKVSAKIIGEVARDLQLIDAPTAPPPASPKQTTLSTQTRSQGNRSPNSAEFPTAVEPRAVAQRQHSTLAGAGIGALLALVIVAGTILYTQHSGSLAAIGVHIEDLVGVRWQKPVQTSEKIPRDRVGETRSDQRQVASLELSEPLPLVSNPAENGATIVTKDSKSLYPGADSPVRSKGSSGYSTSEQPDKPPAAETKAKKQRSSAGTFRVFSASYVRDRPRSDATITGMLEPGTRVRVQSKTGDYFRVRSLDKEPISGYVHREDAFFEPSK
jgi:type II secretory pathway predicted ATPase ExeA